LTISCFQFLASNNSHQPWYLTTFAVAEQLYDALIVWNAQGSLNVTDLSLPFFQQFSSALSPGTYLSSDDTFKTLTTAIKNFADGFIAINANYTPSNGGLAEQFSKYDGTPLSALDLTWSYASALTAFSARNGTVPASWGASGLQVPSVCSSYGGPTVAVTFNVLAYTQFGGECFLIRCLPSPSSNLWRQKISISQDL
jgi:glucoamylase